MKHEYDALDTVSIINLPRVEDHETQPPSSFRNSYKNPSSFYHPPYIYTSRAFIHDVYDPSKSDGAGASSGIEARGLSPNFLAGGLGRHKTEKDMDAVFDRKHSCRRCLLDS